MMLISFKYGSSRVIWVEDVEAADKQIDEKILLYRSDRLDGISYILQARTVHNISVWYVSQLKFLVL